jgi:hypothetical protein
MDDMNRTAVTEMRARRVANAVAARRRLDRAPFPDRRRARRAGRAWVNGVEVGGTDARHATLALGHD